MKLIIENKELFKRTCHMDFGERADDFIELDLEGIAGRFELFITVLSMSAVFSTREMP